MKTSNGGSALICVCSYPTSTIASARRAVEEMQTALALPPEVSPSLARRVAAVAEVWAARVEDVRACRLAGYGAVHPDLARRLDPGVEELRRRLEALADAALRLPATGR
ncbi:MAG TPA: hypothetical protein VM716_06795 [Gemmatimonadales bacterium]|nr:hypothetical protein [Gemmatimonadales bacterium]